MNLTRPLVFFDLETTGPFPETDSIVEIALVTLTPEREVMRWSTWVNPGRPIPASATKVHGITDADVANAPKFAEVAQQIDGRIFGRDLAGYNVQRFDLPMLRAEFARAGAKLDLSQTTVVDVQRVFHKLVPRDLSAAVKTYLGREHEGAHGAMADTEATLEVLLAMSVVHSLEGDAASLAELYADPDAVDDDGKFRRIDGEVFVNFSKHRGRKLADVVFADGGFLEWMLRSDFTESTKAVARDALAKRWEWAKARRGEKEALG